MAVKRLLSIDGGGIRGIIAAQVLVKLEADLKAKGEIKECLAEYFDFISGTSTGSVIAAGLAIGKKAEDILKLYEQKGKDIFTKAKPPKKFEDFINFENDQLKKKIPSEWLWRLQYVESKYGGKPPADRGFLAHWTMDRAINALEKFIKIGELRKQGLQLIGEMLLTKYNPQSLEEVLKDVLGKTTLGSGLKTNLMIVTQNVTTGEPWFFVNNTVKSGFIQPAGRLELNKDVLLTDIVRASCAAPTFFPPHSFKVKVQPTVIPPVISTDPNIPIMTTPRWESKEVEYEFIDGGITQFNNSSLQLLFQATDPTYGTGWKIGENRVMLMSIGTGDKTTEQTSSVKKYNNLNWAQYCIGNLMYGANKQQDNVTQAFNLASGDYAIAPGELIRRRSGKEERATRYIRNEELFSSEDEDPIIPLFYGMNQFQTFGKQFAYQRIQVEFEKEKLKELQWEKQELERLQQKKQQGQLLQGEKEELERLETQKKQFEIIGNEDELVAKFAQMDCTDQIDNLKALGRAVANAYVNINLFQGFDEEVKPTEGIAAN